MASERAAPCEFRDLSFLPLGLEHHAELHAFLSRHEHPLSGYTAAMLFVWNETFDYQWTITGPGTLFVSAVLPGEGRRHLMQPIGPLSAACAAALVDLARRMPYPLKVVGVAPEFVAEHPELTRAFEVADDRDSANYIYSASDLAHLAGRAYAKKRNLIAQAAHLYAWTEEPLSAANVDACREVIAGQIAEELGPPTRWFAHDTAALERALALFAELELDGVLVRVEGRPAGFAIIERQTSDTATVHFERALRVHKGLYQVVNRAAARAIESRGFRFVNREEDLGLEGLRQAKESYNPVRLAEARVLVFRG